MKKQSVTLEQCLDLTTPVARTFQFSYPSVDANNPSAGVSMPSEKAWEKIKDAFFDLPGSWAIQGQWSGVVTMEFHAVAEDGKVYSDDDYRAMIAAVFFKNWR